MRIAKIALPKRDYLAGEMVEGSVVVDCDNSFGVNSVSITFFAREHTKIVVSSGDSSTTYREEKPYCKERITLFNEGELPSGETRLPFKFRIPENGLSTYHGTWGHVEYTLEAKVDIPWAFDIVSKGEINVTNCVHPPDSKSLRVLSDRKEFPDLQVEVSNNVVCIGDELKFTVCVSGERRMRGLKVEVVNRQWAKAKRVIRDGDSTVLYKYFEKSKMRANSWITMRFKTGPKIPPSFETEIMKSKLMLKVTIDVPWDFDTSVYVPITVANCPAAVGEDEFSFDSMF